MSQLRQDNSGYQPQIDALRAIAVGAVMVHHLCPLPMTFGHEGVRLFFVISGFLITSILIKCRDDLPDRWFALRQFYARRFLRIFPAYYLLLVVLMIFPDSEIRATAEYHFTYTSNFWFAWVGAWTPWTTAPFWSLAIEEQFYLLWPIAVLWTPRKWLVPLIVGMIAIAPASRALLFEIGANDVARYVLPPASLDALGAGALIACVERKIINGLGLAALAGMALMTLIGSSDWATYVVFEALLPFTMALVVAACRRGIGGPLGSVLSFPPLLYLGRISYGLYLYHIAAILFVWKVLEPFGLIVPPEGPMRLLIVGSATVLIASLSWCFYEAPINRLKKLFPYRRERNLAPVQI